MSKPLNRLQDFGYYQEFDRNDPYEGQGTCDQGKGSGYLWKEQEPDAVNQPPHYGDGTIECIDYMKDNMDTVMFMGYLEGNTKKYLHRFRYKGKPMLDLKKARWYLDRLIKEYENG